MSLHFDFPLRLGPAGSLATVTQDSYGDIVASTVGVLAYRKGFRIDRPERGIDDPTFRQGGANLDAIREDLAEQEPRADAEIERDPALLPALLDIVTVTTT